LKPWQRIPQVVVGCAADLPAGILQFSTNGVWITPATFTGVQCAKVLEVSDGRQKGDGSNLPVVSSCHS